MRIFVCSSCILIALAHTLIALTHLNSTEKMHRLLSPPRKIPCIFASLIELTTNDICDHPFSGRKDAFWRIRLQIGVFHLPIKMRTVMTGDEISIFKGAENVPKQMHLFLLGFNNHNVHIYISDPELWKMFRTPKLDELFL